MNRIVCTLNVGRDVLHENARRSMREAARRWGANYAEVVRGNGLHHWEEKAHLDEHFSGQCRVLYYDADVVIRHDCPNPFEVVPEDELGLMRNQHAGEAAYNGEITRVLSSWCRKVGIALSLDEYAHGGMMLFGLPLHRELFELTRQIIQRHGFSTNWIISDQAPFSAARLRLDIPTFWIPTMFAMFGNQLRSRWSSEMKTVGYHFTGFGNRDRSIARTVWDDLGPDRFYKNVKRWHNGKPIGTVEGPVVPVLIKEAAKVWRGQIAEVGVHMGGLTWWGAQIARDNYSEWHCIDHWRGAGEVDVEGVYFKAFELNMREAGLDEFIRVHKKSPEEAASDFKDESLDIVFFNGDQNKKIVIEDVEPWWPKLKRGGAMVGQDFPIDKNTRVIDAVKERFGEPESVSVGQHRIWKITKSGDVPMRAPRRPVRNRIFACVTVYEDCDGYLPHFVDHYTRLGVDRLFLIVNKAKDISLLDTAYSCAKNTPTTVVPVAYVEEFTDYQKEQGELTTLAQYATDEDWILHLDLDEFHKYPASLRDVCDAQDAARNPAIIAGMVDRLSEDGSLKAISRTPTIFEQFPWGCTISRDWMKVSSNKVMISKKRLRLSEGRHWVHNASVGPPAIGRWDDYKVYHFKFVKNFRNRAAWRMGLHGLNMAYRRQVKRVADSIWDDKFVLKNMPSIHWCGKMEYPA